MNVPIINGEVEYQSYNIVENRIKQFKRNYKIGTDESGDYDMYKIELGDETKPTIMLQSGLHGTEWQGVQYTLKFMEMLENDNYPDKDFREKLLNNFHIVYIPIANPWGYANTNETSRVGGRNNSNDVDLNRDFEDFTQQETNIIKDVILEYKPFAFLDVHLIIASGTSLIIGNGQIETEHIRNEFADLWSSFTGHNVTLWSSNTNNPGLVRTYVAGVDNEYTQHSLSYITEIGREADNTPSVNTNEDIYNYGMASLYIFFNTSIKYFESENNIVEPDEFVYKIVAPNKTVYLYRDNEGVTNSIIEEFINGDIVETIINRDSEGNVDSFEKKLIDSDGD